MKGKPKSKRPQILNLLASLPPPHSLRRCCLGFHHAIVFILGLGHVMTLTSWWFFRLVSRISARSEQFDMLIHLDVNIEIYPMHAGEKFMLVLASTLNLDGTPDSGYYTPGNKKSLADKFDFVMQGKLYRISEESSEKQVKADIYVSFGGLLMMLKGDPSIAARFELDQRLFILIRKV
ncbi:hypothetical protein SASPL_117646 [Salvia splendens]|uniref:DNA-directed RNA polymerases I, II, and III subunit RPABC3 n=2 Tax=Salvia splendens TaxID=180675 RepID=A0A8X8ZWH4_SALSN|nr:hypothetical protein SASPL_117646 [Salvia splendens]